MKLFIFVLLIVIFLAPLVTIWAINTLFPVVNIPYTLETWAATVILISILSPSTSTKK